MNRPAHTGAFDHRVGRAPAPFVAALFALLLGAAGCATPGAPDDPYALVLGTAQDGGLPQVGCDGPHCSAAREDPARRRLVSSILVADPRTGSRWLFDATPDLPAQVERARGHPPTRPEVEGRPPLFEGVFLTHAHVGHYTGLAHLGREVYGARATPVHASPRMGAFLRENGPWSLLVEAGHVELREIEPGRPVRLADDLVVEALRVPHRDEFSDTLAFVVRGPSRALLYLPDIDKWERWELPVEAALADVDVALLDGSFFADGEIPGRAMADIPHPFVEESLARFAALPAAERAKVRFTHLNHTNPASDPDWDAAARVLAAGMAVAADGELYEL